jgi:thymidylate synthase (methanogen type)
VFQFDAKELITYLQKDSMADSNLSGDGNGITELIHSQTGSNGKKGWPVSVRDRVSYSNTETGSNVAVTFLWTMRDAVMPGLKRDNLAIAANFYTPTGLEGMVRNILGNPYIRYVILLGNEYSSNVAGKDSSELTSANAIRAFFGRGIDENRKIPGFENSVYFDSNIPTEMIQKLRENVELIDLNSRMPEASLDEKIAEANRLISELERKGPFMDRPATFEYEKAEHSFPYEGGPLIVRGGTIPKTWIEIMHTIYRYGRDNLMDANTDRWVKEINNIVAVIHDPQSIDLSVNPFLVPMTDDKISAYQKEILSPELPEGKAYTYGNKLRAYMHSNASDVKKLVDSTEYKDFEFGQGPHLDRNVRYMGEGCAIDQIEDIIEALKRNAYSKSVVAITWHVHEELMRKHKSTPCLVMLQAMVQDEKLNLTVFFRSHDMVQGWPENAYGCAAIQKKIADGIGLEPGLLTIISGSAQIYKHYYKQVEDMLGKFRSAEEMFSDPHGNFLVEVAGGVITARLTDPKTGTELERFEGRGAKDVYTQIAFSGSIDTAHAAYLGSELKSARDRASEQPVIRAGQGASYSGPITEDITCCSGCEQHSCQSSRQGEHTCTEKGDQGRHHPEQAAD